MFLLRCFINHQNEENLRKPLDIFRGFLYSVFVKRGEEAQRRFSMMTNNAFQNIMALTSTMNMINANGVVRMTVTPILAETGMVKAVRVVISNDHDFDYIAISEEELNKSWDEVMTPIVILINRMEQN